MDKEALLQDIRELNNPAVLDDLVHDAASQIASAVNGEGLVDQLDWLEEHGVDESHIRSCLGLKEGQ